MKFSMTMDAMEVLHILPFGTRLETVLTVPIDGPETCVGLARAIADGAVKLVPYPALLGIGQTVSSFHTVGLRTRGFCYMEPIQGRDGMAGKVWIGLLPDKPGQVSREGQKATRPPPAL